MTEEKNVYDGSRYGNSPPVDDGFNRGAVAPHGSAMLAKSGEKGSLPVLEAFQEFLEDERKRSRNRMFILTSIFTLLLFCVIFCGLFIGSVYLAKMKDEVKDVRYSSETELLCMQNETLRAMNNNRGNVTFPHQPMNNSGMSDGQKAQVLLMMQESRAEIDKLQAKIDHLQNQNITVEDGPSNAAISNALVNVMREVSNMRKDMNSGASYYTPIKRPAEVKPVPVAAPQISVPVVETVVVKPAVQKAPVVVEEKEKPLPTSISVTIKPAGQGIVCAVPMEL